MAAVRSALPVGSAQWLVNEAGQVNQLVQLEAEEFSYSAALHEVEWLNEHMAEIFNRSQLNVVDAFKTPGKLRGKTPRTVRKRNPLETRAPLTDIFAPNVQASSGSARKNLFSKPNQKARVAEDQENEPTAIATLRKSLAAREAPAVKRKSNVDSGYHGTTDDDMDIDKPLPPVVQPPPRRRSSRKRSSGAKAPQVTQKCEEPAKERCLTGESFFSAKEDLEGKQGAKPFPPAEDIRKPEKDVDVDVEMSDAEQHEEPSNVAKNKSTHFSISAETASAMDTILQDTNKADAATDEMDVDGPETSSEGSSPAAKQIVRKSSLTFASLPAREPLATKKSMGAQASRHSQLDQVKARGGGHSSIFARKTSGLNFGTSQEAALMDVESSVDVRDAAVATQSTLAIDQESNAAKVHNKTSTQLLHERINMLGQSKEPAISKSMSTSATNSQPSYPQLPHLEDDKVPEASVTSPATGAKMSQREYQQNHSQESDWMARMKPLPSTGNLARPQMIKSHTMDVMDHMSIEADAEESVARHQAPATHSPSPKPSPSRLLLNHAYTKSVSALVASSPSKASGKTAGQKAISVSNPYPHVAPAISHPADLSEASAGKKYLDGPLTASKAKLYSVLKSAKGIFASSASISADAKMEALSPHTSRLRNLGHGYNADMNASGESVASGSNELYPSLKGSVPESRSVSSTTTGTGKAGETGSIKSFSDKEDRKRAKEAKEQQRRDAELEKARAKERVKAAVPAPKGDKSKAKEQTLRQVESERESDDEDHITAAPSNTMPPPVPAKSLLPTSQAAKPGQARRLAKPSKESLSKSKPPPMSIRVPSQRIGQVQPASGGFNASQESIPPPPPPKQSISTKNSNTSMNTAYSNNSLKGSTSSRPKALDAAARKKEQEEKAAQRKAELKREAEQKRAAKIEEEKRAEQQRKMAEQRAQEAKRAAQRQPNPFRSEKADELVRIAKTANTKTRLTRKGAALQQEKAHAAPAHSRADLGTGRPLSRMNSVQDLKRPLVPHINPAKPPQKRALQNDTEDNPLQQPATQKAGQSYQQMDAKRRKTIEEDQDPLENRRSVMAPPIRQSNIRKEPNKFPHGYTTAPSTSHAPSMFKSTVTAQHQLQHAKLGGHPNDMAKFSNAKIPFAETPNPPALGQSSTHHGPFKTPARNETITKVSTITTVVPVKSSPQYPAGENIALPEIATDSESDGENEFAAPDWVNSPALRELLTQQQLMDPEKIFGPIAPLHMEEIFKNKDRHKRFRDRTSSANWSGADKLTEDERRRDREGREKLMKEGGWTFHSGT